MKSQPIFIPKKTQTQFAAFEQSVPSGKILFLEGETCSHIAWVVEGEIVIRSTCPEGNETVIQTVFPGQFFGDVMLFAQEEKYLGNVVSVKPSVIAFFDPDAFLKMLQSEEGLLKTYLRENAIKTFELKQSMKLLTQPNLREKILFFLRTESLKQGKTLLRLSMNRESLAAKLGVCRPSLSRELSRMQDAGLIRCVGKTIALL